MATKKFSSLHTPRPQYWYDVSLGRAGINLSNICNTQKSIVGVRVYISSKVVDVFYPKLEARKQEINKALGCEPEWNPNPNARDKTITLQYDNCNLVVSVSLFVLLLMVFTLVLGVLTIFKRIDAVSSAICHNSN